MKFEIYKKRHKIIVQLITQQINASMTAALPKSLARLDKSCVSKEMRSMAASTLEFNSSTISTKNIAEIMMDLSTPVRGK